MVTEWQIDRRKKICEACSAQFVEGQSYISALDESRSGQFRRRDVCEACWEKGEKDKFFSFWRARLPKKGEKSKENVPAIIQIFKKLNADPQGSGNAAKLQYLLALVLMRKRVLRMKDQVRDEHGTFLEVESLPDHVMYRVPDLEIPEAEMGALKDEFSKMLEMDL
jgi:hypothetical protein